MSGRSGRKARGYDMVGDKDEKDNLNANTRQPELEISRGIYVKVDSKAYASIYINTSVCICLVEFCYL